MITPSFDSLPHGSARSKLNLTAHTIVRSVLLVLSVLSVLPAKSRAQLLYDHTTLLHGLGSGSYMWTTSYADIGTTPPSYLSGRFDLKTIAYPSLDSSKTYAGQVSNLASYLTVGGQHVLVAHSLGSLVARGTYLDNPSLRPEIAAIIAVTAPHQGAPLADNFVLLRSYLRDMQRRIEDATVAASIEASVLNMIFMYFAPFKIKGFGPLLLAPLLYRINSTTIDFTTLDQLGAPPAVADLPPGSGAIAHLNASFDDGSIPRANIYATIPFRNAALRLFQSSKDDDAGFPGIVRTRDIAQEVFSACKWIGYVTIIQWTAGRRCAYARKTLGRLDERWARYVNGWDQSGKTLYVPFDGVVPNERSRYPSTNAVAFQSSVNLINHFNVYKTRAGLDEVAKAMGAIRMLVVPGSPGQSVSPVAINGPSTVTFCGGSWFASPAGGLAPFTYVWTARGQTFNTATSNQFDYSPTALGTLTIGVTVTDANGTTGTGSKSVTVSSRGAC